MKWNVHSICKDRERQCVANIGIHKKKKKKKKKENIVSPSINEYKRTNRVLCIVALFIYK
jgi:hypothetical protein